jgi:hypothetical protein
VNPFPHADIAEEGPRITAHLAPLTRDHDDYWHRRPSDHSAEGLFVGATEGEHCTLDALIGYTFCTISAPTPEGERRRHVVNKSRRVSNGGRFGRPVKPANSGRKRKAA